MKAHEKWSLLVLNGEDYEYLLMLSLIKFQKFYTFSGWKIKMPMIQKWNKMFFLDIFIWFDRARRALQNWRYSKRFLSHFLR